jgi:hypothetical protein
MTVDAKRIPPIHQRRFEMGRRAEKPVLPGADVIAGSLIGVPQWLATVYAGARPSYLRLKCLTHKLYGFMPLQQTYTRAMRKRRFPRPCRIRCFSS